MTERTGKVAGTGTAAQHVDLYRKLALRRALLSRVGPGPAFVPFCGEGDIAAELYADRDCWLADLDPARVDTAAARFATCHAVAGDCDVWPFGDACPAVPWALADFDAYAYPYDSFRAWWGEGGGSSVARCGLIFTDGQRQGIKRSGSWHHPDGHHERGLALNEKRHLFNAYWARVAKPWLIDAVAPMRVTWSSFYLRGHEFYYAALVER